MVRAGIVLLSVTLFFGGCETNQQRAKLMDREQQKVDYAKTILKQRSATDARDLKRMELESKRELAKIEMQKAVEVEKVKAEVKKAELMTKKEMALKEAEIKKSEIEKEDRANSWIVTLAILFFSVLSFLVYKLFRDHQRVKLQLHREKMSHEAKLKEKELQARMVEKIIEAVGEGKLTPEQHERLIESLNGGRRLINR
ncbi:hypothetical protein [Hydrogenimonas sp.]